MTAFNEFVLSQLPPPPGRVLEIGCGDRGGVVAQLEAAGFEPLGVDPRAPEGPRFRQETLEELDDPGPFVAVVASRVVHHVRPLGPALDKLAGLAPLLVLDEFAPEKIDSGAQEWYERQHRALRLAGQEPIGPPSLDEWRAAHTELHPSTVLLDALRERYDVTHFEERPYLYRWLGGVATEHLEEALVGAGAIPAIGFRWVGRSKAGAA
jgi:Methyltransferase domain